ncbi:hypothetical protein H7J87_15390 [Mycolicibacterium wolinskyi]|uniref:hypothetical protein n=1 Tax=Mycolicibacterium TaxID=1866885 RepID=UPI0013FDA27E|nr:MULTISPECIES: hypothetical protein [Mycolicibacterium]MCV7286711.1 hypothetical protein [Mycolicibacterium wolinskyi]MCV7293691.1 hypothetical protein [Mycolicibacterium goodii]
MATRILLLSFWLMVAVVGYADKLFWLVALSLAAFVINAAMAVSRWTATRPGRV